MRAPFRRRPVASLLILSCLVIGAGPATVRSPVPALTPATAAPERASPTFPSSSRSNPTLARAESRPAIGHVDGGGLSLAITDSGATGVLSAAVDGRVLTGFPLAAVWPGQRAPSRVSAARSQSGWAISRSDTRGVVEQILIEPEEHGIALAVSARPPTGGPVTFLSDGDSGVDLRRAVTAYSPGASQFTLTSAPAVDITGWHALTPAPMDLQLRSAGVWIGIGVAEVPAARSIALRDGGLTIDYPPADAPMDMGGGTAADGMVHFPRLVLTMADSPLQGLHAYHDVLTDLGDAPGSVRPGPAWWREPICDTWGEQTVTGAMRDSSAFTAGWVRGFAAACRQRLGTTAFTVVIDARWQQDIGEALPAARFGGAAGMRALIDELHAAGEHVLLWWPLWIDGPYSGGPPTYPIAPGESVDPSTPGFAAAIAARMATVTGAGAGQLHADGLKVDWEYSLPDRLGAGGGALALFRYLAALHAGIDASRPDALLDASSASPQFASVTDDVRLYDAGSPRAWDDRAAVVAAADPGTLIDADGWVTTSTTGLQHYLDGAVFGIPALYYVSRWGDRVPLGGFAQNVLSAITAVTAVTSDRAAGVAFEAGPEQWTWKGADGSRLQELGGDAVLAVPAHAGCSGSAIALLATITSTEVALPADLDVIAASQPGAAVQTFPGGQRGARVTVAAGSVMRLTLASSC